MKKIIVLISVLTIAVMAMAACSGEAKNSRVKSDSNSSYTGRICLWG